MENRPRKPLIANRRLLSLFNHGVVRFSLGRVGALPPSIHCVCVTTSLRATRGFMSSRSLLRGLAERIRKVGSALLRARGREPFLLWRQTRDNNSNRDTSISTRRALAMATKHYTWFDPMCNYSYSATQGTVVVSLFLHITVFPVILFTAPACLSLSPAITQQRVVPGTIWGR